MIDYLLLAVAAACIVYVLMYNRLRRARVAVSAAMGQVDVHLRRRADLIPQLVTVVAEYAKHERSTLDRVASQRAAEQIFLIAEAYPELRADELFRNLQLELAATESRLAYARSYYNERVQALNALVLTFPYDQLAKQMQIPAFEFLDVELTERSTNVAF